MADPIAEAVEAQCGKQLSVQNVQIDNLTVSEDGSGHAMVSFETVNEDAAADSETPVFDQHDTSADGFVFGDERDDEDTPASGGSKGPWTVGDSELTHGELQETVSKLCEAGEISEYPGNGGDQLAGALRDHKLSEEVSEMPVNDENDEYPETNDDGISYRVSDGGTKWYKVGDDEMTHNGLQKAASRQNNYPESPTVANLIEVVKGDSTEETHETTEEDDSDDSNTAYTGKGQPSEEWLVKHGVDPSDAGTVQRFRGKNGVCWAEGCEHGANKNGDGRCKACADEDRTKIEVTYEDEEDRGNEVQKLAKMFDVSPMTVEKGLEDYEDGVFGSKKEAIDFHDN